MIRYYGFSSTTCSSDARTRNGISDHFMGFRELDQNFEDIWSLKSRLQWSLGELSATVTLP